MKRLSKIFLLLFAMTLFLAPVALLAQDEPAGPIEIDLAWVVVILATGLFGIPVSSLIQLVKGWLNWDGGKVKILAFLISAAATAVFLVPLGLFSVPVFAGCTILVWGEAVGFFKVTKKNE